MQLVVVRLVLYSERTVLRPIPSASGSMQIESQLVAAALLRQLTEQLIAEPVVTSRVAESNFELRPRTIEEIRPVNVLLD